MWFYIVTENRWENVIEWKQKTLFFLNVLDILHRREEY